MSKEHLLYLKKIKKDNILVIFFQILIFMIFIILWEILANTNIFNTFLTSSPSLVIKTIIQLFNQDNLFNHIFVTIFETFISFILATLIGIFVASILWWNKFISRVVEPYLTVINSMPKVALGPILIIWLGANTNSIIFMALLVSIIITIITIQNGFLNTDENKIKLMHSLNATKWQVYKLLIFPSNIKVIISSLKINISMSLIGVIMGELLVSKEGIGYLIMYGSQVFNLNLVITGIILLCLISYIMYYIVSLVEKKFVTN